MKTLIISIVCIIIPVSVFAQRDAYVDGYFRSDGKYVVPYYRTFPNKTPYDNYSTQGSQNAYTGQQGQRNQNRTYVPPLTFKRNYGIKQKNFNRNRYYKNPKTYQPYKWRLE